MEYQIVDQILCDLYEVTFNDVKRLPSGNVIVHFQNKNDTIKLGEDDAVVVGEPYLEPLSRYGGGFKTKVLVKKNCIWLGRQICNKIKNQEIGSKCMRMFRE